MESSLSHKKSITLPTWKMYENPLYPTTTTQLEFHDPVPQYSSSSAAGIIINNNNNTAHCSTSTHDDDDHQYPPPVVPKLHILHLPISARKIAASFWDLSFINKPVLMKKGEEEEKVLKLERRWRWKKAEESLILINKKKKKSSGVGRELWWEERKRREAVERVCEQLEGEISKEKEEMCRLKMEMEEERKMMRISELFREERLRMKLAEARALLMEMEEEKKFDHHQYLRLLRYYHLHYYNCQDHHNQVMLNEH